MSLEFYAAPAIAGSGDDAQRGSAGCRHSEPLQEGRTGDVLHIQDQHYLQLLSGRGFRDREERLSVNAVYVERDLKRSLAKKPIVQSGDLRHIVEIDQL